MIYPKGIFGLPLVILTLDVQWNEQKKWGGGYVSIDSCATMKIIGFSRVFADSKIKTPHPGRSILINMFPAFNMVNINNVENCLLHISCNR